MGKSEYRSGTGRTDPQAKWPNRHRPTPKPDGRFDARRQPKPNGRIDIDRPRSQMADLTPDGSQSQTVESTSTTPLSTSTVTKTCLQRGTMAISSRRPLRHCPRRRLLKPAYRGARWPFLHDVHYATAHTGGY